MRNALCDDVQIERERARRGGREGRERKKWTKSNRGRRMCAVTEKETVELRRGTSRERVDQKKGTNVGYFDANSCGSMKLGAVLEACHLTVSTV